MSGAITTLVLDPSNTPRSQGVENLGQLFTDQDAIQFEMPPQDLDIMAVTLTCYFGIITPSGQNWTLLDMTQIELNPKTGVHGLFQNINLGRISPNIIDATLNPPLTAKHLSDTLHTESDFMSCNAGNYLDPGASFLCTPSQGTWQFGASQDNQKYPNYKLKPAAFCPLLALLNARRRLNLAEMGGFTLNLTVGYVQQAFQAFSASTPFAGATANMPYLWASGYAVNNFYNFGSCKLAIVMPKLRLQVKVARPNGISPAIVYSGYTITKAQAYPGESQSVSHVMPRTLLKEINWYLSDRSRTQKQQFGPYTTCCFNLSDQTLLWNSVPQKFQYPTGKVSAARELSQVMPNAFVLVSMSEYSQSVEAPKIFGGSVLNWPYDPDGNGILVEGAIATLLLKAGQRITSRAPWNQQANVPATAVLGFGTEVYRQINTGCAPFDPALYGPQPQNINANLTLKQSLLSKMFLFNQQIEASTNLDLVLITTDTRTTILRGDTVAQVPAARPAVSVPQVLDYNTAAPRSSVNRVVERRVNGVLVANPPQNTQLIEFLQPDTGLTGPMCLYVCPKIENAQTTINEVTYVWASLTLTSKYWNSVGSTVPWLGKVPVAVGAPTYGIDQLEIAVSYNNAQPAWTIGYKDAGYNTPATALSVSKLPVYRGNRHFYARGYPALGGSLGFLRSLMWTLPKGVTVQELDLQTNALLQRHGVPFYGDLLQTEFDSHLTNGYVHSSTQHGVFEDVLENRDRGTAFDSWSTTTPYTCEAGAYTDYSTAKFGWYLCAVLQHIHESVRKMIGVPLNTKERRLLTLGFDTSMMGLADAGCGYGCGFITNYSQNNTDAAHAFVSAQFTDAQRTYVQRVLSTWTLDTKNPPYMVIQTIFHDPITQASIVKTFESDGVEMTIEAYDLQRRAAGEIADGVNLDEISNGIKFQIGGRNPRVFKILNRELSLYTGDRNFRRKDPVLGTPASRANFLPPYIAGRCGALFYSLPLGLNDYNVINEKAPLTEVSVQIDNELLSGTYNYGTFIANAEEYAKAYGTTLARPDFEIMYNTFRRRSVCEDYIRSTQGTYSYDPFQISAYNPINPKARNRGAPHLPSNYVCIVTVPDPFQNGNMVEFTPVGSSKWKLNYLGVPSSLDVNPYIAQARPLCMLRDIAMLYSYNVSFSTGEAEIRYNFPVSTDVK